MLSPFLFVHAASLLRSSPLSAQGDSGRSFSDLLASVQSFVWGPPLIVLLVGTGLYLTLLLRGLQFRQLKHSLWLALVKRREEGAEGDRLAGFGGYAHQCGIAPAPLES